MKVLLTSLFFIGLTAAAQDDESIQRFESLIKNGSYAQAAKELTAYTAGHPNSWQAYYQLGYADFRLHRIQESVTAVCRSLVLNKKYAESHKILAYDLNILGHPEMAVHELSEAIRYDPANAEAHYELGRISYEQGSYVESVQELEKARSLAPESVRVYHNLGLAYSAIGQDQKAIDSFEHGLRLNAKQSAPSAWPYIDYATFLNAKGQFSSARDLLLKAIDIDKSWDQAFSELSKSYRGLNMPDKAVESLRKAVVLNAKNAEYHYVLARLYTQTDHPVEAKQELAAYERSKAHEP